MGKYLFIAGALLLTVAGQLVIRWRAEAHALLRDHAGTFGYLFAMFRDPFVIGALIGAFLAAVSWMLAVQQMPVSVAYPFMALSFILVPWGASWALGEEVNMAQYVGAALVVGGVALSTVWR